MRPRTGVAGAVLLAVAVLGGGCSGGSDEAAPEAPPSTGIPVAPEALAPAPSIRAGDDARTLLRPGGDVSRLRANVSGTLGRVETVHVEEKRIGGAGEAFSYDVDSGEGRCSGTVTTAGVDYGFTTTRDGRMLATTDEGVLGQKLDGRWFEVPGEPLAEYCGVGPAGVTVRSANFRGESWLLAHATRVGVDRIAGRRAVHFRETVPFEDSKDTMRADSWIVADGAKARVVRLVLRYQDGAVTELSFSDFDSPAPMPPEPADDQVLDPAEGPAVTG